jgi:hypothetical protein
MLRADSATLDAKRGAKRTNNYRGLMSRILLQEASFPRLWIILTLHCRQV